jgi:hypothetical protein
MVDPYGQFLGLIGRQWSREVGQSRIEGTSEDRRRTMGIL